MKITRTKVIITTSIVLALGIGGYFMYPSKKEVKEKVETYQVTKGKVVKSVESNGRVIPNLDIEIKCKASGQITQLPVEISDFVKKGQLLLKLDPTDEKRNIKQAEISLLQSRIALSKAESAYLSAKYNYGTGAQQAEINLKNTKIRLDELKAKAQRSAEVYKISPQRKLLLGQLETAKARYKEQKMKLEGAKELYEKGKVISRNDYENQLSQFVQAEGELNSAQAKLGEQDAVNKNDYDSAMSQYKQAQMDYEINLLKQKEQTNSKIELELKNKDIEAAKSKLESDKIALEIAKQRLTDTEVFAPVDGYVTKRDVQVGQIIASGINNVNGGTTVMTVSDPSRLFIIASVDESDISAINLNQKVEITVDAFANKKFMGKVVQIYSKGENNSNVVTFSVKIEITSKDKTLLKPEMTANVRIISGESQNVLVVSSDYVSKEKNKFFVSIQKEGQEPEKKEVQLGLFDNENYEIISGVKAGDVLLPQSSDQNSKWNKRSVSFRVR